MEDLLACRICLSKNNKLYNIFQYKLAEPFKILTGIHISEVDGLPLHICGYCGTLLLKSVSFKQKCCHTQEFLRFSMLEQRVLSEDYLQSVNKELQLSLPLTRTTNTIAINIHTDSQIKLEDRVEVTVAETFSFGVIQDESSEPIEKQRESAVATELLLEFEEVDVKAEEADEVTDNDEGLDVSPPAESDTQDEIKEEIEEMGDIEILHLTKKQQREEVESRKKSFNYTNSFYKCDQCYKGFMTETTFKNHMARHDPKNGDFVCDICHARWSEARLLRAHLVTAHERKYICRLCKHVSRSCHRAKEHAKWHAGFTFVCKICGATFAKSTSHLTHIRLQHPSDHCCEICGESFIGEYGLRMHKRRAHKDNEETKVVAYCDSCSAQFFNMDALKVHFGNRGVCNSDVKPCPYCGVGIVSDEAMKEHLKSHHKENVPCQECTHTFATTNSLATHYQRVHLGLKMKQNKPTLKRAYQTVVCEICGKKCMTKATLTCHQRIHTGERPFQCPNCPKNFSVLQRLQIHVRTHTGECPYKCTHCPKAFKHKAALNRHDRVHTGAKPYVCAHCGKSFSQSNSMKLHVKTVHLKLPAPYRARKTKIETAE